MIDYQEIIKLFDEKEFHIGYLDRADLIFLNNAPVKFELSGAIEDNIKAGIVFVKHTVDYDYSMYKIITDIIPVEFQVWSAVNLKQAAICAGLGQYGKNQLFYDEKFGFDNHIVCILLYDYLDNLPKRNLPNWNFLPQCEGCNDCFYACPVKAIHNQEIPYWVDFATCDNFASWGNHPDIPSMKYMWGEKLCNPSISKETLKYIHSPKEALEALGKQMNMPIKENGKEYWAQLPTCRECASQPKCSKYNGQYPYDKERFIKYDL